VSDRQVSLARSRAANLSWARTEDRTARTLKGRLAFEAKFLEQADGDPKRAEKLRQAHFQNMQAKSVEARKAKADGNRR
jgi:hypothetical protein